MPNISQVNLNEETLLSTLEDTVTPETLLEGATATNSKGEKIVGIVPPMVVDSELDTESTNPVENRAIAERLLNANNTYIADETYLTTDEMSNEISDNDKLPFFDVSDDKKKNTLFSSIVNKLKETFLTLSIGHTVLKKGTESLSLEDGEIDASKADNDISSTHNPTMNEILDKDDRILMQQKATVSSDGKVGTAWTVCNYDTNGNIVGQKGISFNMNKSGDLDYSVSDEGAFRDAIKTIDKVGTALPANTDLNTVITEGTYTSSSDNNTATLVNRPTNRMFKMIVLKFSGDARYKTQIVVTYNSDEVFRRFTVTEGSSWSEWETNFSTKQGNNLVFNYRVDSWWTQIKCYINTDSPYMAYNFSKDGGSTWNGDILLAKLFQIHNLSNQRLTLISANDDLNNYTSAGTYDCKLGATAQSLSNCPVSTAFKMIVDVEDNSDVVTQTITIQNDKYSTPWHRAKHNTAGWGEWRQYVGSTAMTYTVNNNTVNGIAFDANGANGTRAIIQFGKDGKRIRQSWYDGSTWSGESILANLDDVCTDGYAVATINGNAITTTIDGFRLRAGVIVSIYITSEITDSAATLNINSTGAKSIKTWGNEAPTMGRHLHIGLNTFMYDGTVYRLLALDRTPSVSQQSYVANTSGNVLIDWGYDANRAQIKYAISDDKLKWNYYKNSAWKGDKTILDVVGGVTMEGWLGLKANDGRYIVSGAYALSTDSTTLPNCINKLRYSNGAWGSFNLTTAYTQNNVTIPTGWYSYVYIPHRVGGEKWATPTSWNADNVNFGNLLMYGMNNTNGIYRVRYSDAAIKQVERLDLPLDTTHVLQGDIYTITEHKILRTDDLNDFTNAGTYQYSHDNNGLPANCPFTMIHSFKLVVDRYGSSSQSEIMQRITMQNVGNLTATTLDYYRTRGWGQSAWTPWKQLSATSDIVQLTLGEGIPENANLNDYTVNGIYNIHSDAKAATISNIPYPHAGKLIVMRKATEQYVTQYYTTYYTRSADRTYHRSIDLNAATPTWTGWYAFTEQVNGMIALYHETTSANDYPIGINAGIKDTTTGKYFYYDILKAYQDHQASPTGLILLLGGGGATVIGGGEAAQTYYGVMPSDHKIAENLYLMSDSSIFLESNLNDPTNRRGFRINTYTELIPVKAEASTDNYGSLGTAIYKLANVYTYKINGADAINYNDLNILAKANSKNLYLLPYAYTSRTINGVTFTVNDDGSVLVNGTATANTYFCLIEGLRYINQFVDGETYRLTGGKSNNLYVTFHMRELDVNYKDTGNGVNFVFTAGQSYYNSVIGVANGTTVNNVTIYPMIRLLGNGDDTWMPSALSNHYLTENFSKTYVGTCDTAAGTKDKVATVDDGFILRKGVRVAIKFSVTNTYNATTSAPVTLNVNGTGAKQIYYANTATPTGTSTNAFGGANKYSYYVYDGSYWVWDGQSQDNNNTNYLRNDASSVLTASTPYISLKASNIDLTQANNGVSSTVYPAYIFQDKNGKSFNRLESCVYADGTVDAYWYMQNFNTSGTSQGQKGIRIKCNKSGQGTWAFSDPHNVNKALGSGYGTCDTAEATIAKVVTMANYVLASNGYVSVRFTNGVPANATMNINNKGAKPIWYRNEAIKNGIIRAGDLATFIYVDPVYHLIGVDRGDTELSTSDVSLDANLYDCKKTTFIHGNLNGEQLFFKAEIEFKPTSALSYAANDFLISIRQYNLLSTSNNFNWQDVQAYINGTTMIPMVLVNDGSIIKLKLRSAQTFNANTTYYFRINFTTLAQKV